MTEALKELDTPTPNPSRMVEEYAKTIQERVNLSAEGLAIFTRTDLIAILTALTDAVRKQERERCAGIARQGGCNNMGCDNLNPSMTQEDEDEHHSNLCPVGIASAIRKGE